MIIKMWGVKIEKVIKRCFDTERAAKEHKRQYGGQIKPVWVCDRDPHENVREQVENSKSFMGENYTDSDNVMLLIADAALKDLKNTDTSTSSFNSAQDKLSTRGAG
jgi:hypothetical protein